MATVRLSTRVLLRARGRGVPRASPRPHRAPQLRHHFQSFLTGGVAALAFGYYRVHQDVWRAAEAVDVRLDALGRETVSSHATLQARVKALEQEVARLKAVGSMGK